MTHTYNISGMTCSGCQNKVEGLLSKVDGVEKVSIDLAKGTANIEMAKHIPTVTLKIALADYPKYQLSEVVNPAPVFSTDNEDEKKSWFEIYKPILLIFAYITVTSLIAALSGDHFNLVTGMRIFMAGFFIIFSFFKMLNLNGFADSYSMYDIVAKKFRSWGYIYPFIELFLGLGYAANLQPDIINYITLVVMSVSIIGVLQSVLNKRKIRCACLGAVFNLPMSTVTIIEDALMIAMSVTMLIIMQ
ncbi:heavy-metal-associated domain-containing protein [Mucilaginibacter sp.]|uniref:heavy-metal-associated domain-containing protein n=1 Tax=Mucilaginibacter sp. TaxID=1882438 RepID=UPI002632CBBF|nr:cation transporter [Mucilaginibacter sp.]MDB4921577.1 heavy-metal-associated protein [Mucilaginibacter sp.]